MKKTLALALIAGGIFTLASCKKDYTCTVSVLGIESTVEYNDLDKDEAEAAETACTAAGGTWATK